MRQESLTSLLVRWEEALVQGRELTPEEPCAGGPELLDAVRDGIDAVRRLRALPASNGSNPSMLGPDATIPPLPPEFRRDVAVAGMVSPPGYEIIGELGRGGMGVIYRARQTGLNRVVALKMILSGGHAGVEERMRFLGEAEAIAKVRHPGIVQVYDFGMHGGCRSTPWSSATAAAWPTGSTARRCPRASA